MKDEISLEERLEAGFNYTFCLKIRCNDIPQPVMDEIRGDLGKIEDILTKHADLRRFTVEND